VGATVTLQAAHATTKISQPSCPKRLVVAKLIGWCVLLKLWQLFFFSYSYFLSSLLEICARLTKNQGCPLIYFVFQLRSFFFWLVFLCFGFFLDCFFFLFQFHHFSFDFVLFLYQIWYSFSWLFFFILFLVCFFLLILFLNILFHFFFQIDPYFFNCFFFFIIFLIFFFQLVPNNLFHCFFIQFWSSFF